MKNILITGGCGFVGTNLAKYLQDLGHKIIILDNLSVCQETNLFNAGITICSDTLVIADVRDGTTLNRLFGDKIDVVVHLAALTGVLNSVSYPEETWDNNVNGTLKLLASCKLAGIKKFIYASSNAALGAYQPPFVETLVPQPLSPLGASKAACEMLCSAYHYSYGVETVCLRFSNCYGLYSKHKTSVVAKFIKQLMGKEPLTIYGNGKQSRDFVNVKDICQAVELCVKQDNVQGVYQIASGTETTINKLADMLMDIANIDVDIIYKPQRLGEIQRNYSDISKAKNELGYKPQVKLQRGLEDLWEWYSK